MVLVSQKCAFFLDSKEIDKRHITNYNPHWPLFFEKEKKPINE